MIRLPLCLAIVAMLASAPPARAATLEWVRQLGTSANEYANGVSVDGLGNVYITGDTDGSLGGPNAGDNDSPSDDAYVAKYDAAGSLLWTRQFGTTIFDRTRGVSADGLGNVYITGYTGGSLGGPLSGFTDGFLAKYDAAGSLLWTRQLGSTSLDSGNGVSADGLGNVYITGSTRGSLGGQPHAGGVDAFVAKYDSAGSLLWTRQLGTSMPDESYGVSADGLGNVYISGSTRDSLGGQPHAGVVDAFVAKYDAAGALLWIRQLGTAAGEFSNGVSVDGLGSVYISGYTLGGPYAGSGDAFVAKYDAAGILQWTRQLGTASYEAVNGISADVLGNVYVSGSTRGSLGGSNAGGSDAFVLKYDAAGALLWIRQLGTTAGDISGGVSVDGPGSLFVVGGTSGSMNGDNAGGADAFLVKFVDGLPGDFNGDGAVDGGDFLAWQRGLGSLYTADDLQTWKANFGTTADGAAAGAQQIPVPEPSALALMLAAMIASLGETRPRGRVSPRRASR